MTKCTIMKKKLRIIFTLLFISLVSFSPAQSQPDHFVYAITSMLKSGTEWISLRKLNTQTSEFTTVIFNGMDNSIPIYDASSMRRLVSFVNDTIANSNPQLAFGSGVAAIGYDKGTNRVFYTPMMVDQLRYLDLNTMRIYGVTGQSFAKAGNFEFMPGTISRMVVVNGYGYTITNDGNHLFQFNTSGSPAINDLGPLEDAATNSETVHNPCGNAGGDLIADDNGNLYLISASNKVFKVDVSSRSTQFLGTISGLPASFNTNGAAVDEDGNLIISSSTYTIGYFSVNPQTWSALPYKPIDEMYGTADLANSNLLHTSTAVAVKAPATNNNIKIFPNPVSSNVFNIQFSNVKPGNYTMQLTDAFGGKVMQQNIKIGQASQTELINVPGGNAQGSYFLILLDANNSNVYSQIILIERN
jgi:hypothetical protein